MRLLIVIGLLILLCLPTSAQTFRGGFRFGVTATQVSGDMLSGFDKAGLTGGFVLSLPLHSEGSLQTELMFIQKGSRRNPTKTSSAKYIMRLNYIEMPFTYRRWVGNFAIEGGFSFGYLFKNYDIEYDANGIIPGMDPFNSFEFAAHLGLIYQISDHDCINFRYSNSILPIREHAGGGTYWLNQGQYNSVLNLSLIHYFFKS